MGLNSAVRERLSGFQNGTNHRIQDVLGAHFAVKRGKSGVVFRTWAPNAKSISVVGDFNGWNRRKTPMKKQEELGVWEAFAPGLEAHSIYKYSVEDQTGVVMLKSDPYALQFEIPPANASRVMDIDGFRWTDKRWMQKRAKVGHHNRPINIYEVHPGSWRRSTDGSCLDYVQLANELSEYLADMGYTHVELMPVMEHCDQESWGYRVNGYFAPTSRCGTPHEMMQFVNIMHKAGIGVILDWVPSHFPKDEQGLVAFDGTPCYEYADPVKGEHAACDAKAFDLGRPQVHSFLISSALFWIERYHIDGLRIGSLASMLYLDLGRQGWTPNALGGRENLEAVDFLKTLTTAVLGLYPDVMMIAEESTNWPLVTKPPHAGGLGFNYKWYTGWRGDIMEYVELDPWYRSYNHDKLTFSIFEAFSENHILPVSHDEIVHGKKSLIEKMPGPYQQKFAGVRAFLGYMMSHPGKKLLFMGGEFGQFTQWDAQGELDWPLLDYEIHCQLRDYVRELNHFYLEHAALWQVEDSWEGFKWIVPDDNSQNIVVFQRMDEKDNELVVAVNFAPVERRDYRFGVTQADSYSVVLCSEDVRFGGIGYENPREILCDPIPSHGRMYSITLVIPPMSAVWLTPNGLKRKRSRISAGRGKKRTGDHS